MPKADNADQANRLTDIPNIGPSSAADLRSIDFAPPDDVRRKDPLVAYKTLRGPAGQRHDPCALNAFVAAHDFMNGGAARPWWRFTAKRKALRNRFEPST